MRLLGKCQSETAMLSEDIKNTVLRFQENEISEHYIYRNLSEKAKGENSEILKRISQDELRHYNEWKKHTGADVSPNRLKVLKFLIISKIFGLTFAVKMMESGEKEAEEVYANIIEAIPEAKKILDEEAEHENRLIAMIDEEKIGYISSMVLGLNDALVELTGALAGLTLTFQNARLIAVAGLITGIAASLSMSASEYLSQKSEGNGKSPVKASFYTGIVYFLTVLLLVAPYFILADYYLALAVMVTAVVCVVLFFSFFVSVVKELSFKRMFLEMIVISLGVAAISFVIGWLAQGLLNIEV
jgi:VIT1/CCC1 family predicted Fe2+/Mn2+ transporter